MVLTILSTIGMLHCCLVESVGTAGLHEGHVCNVEVYKWATCKYVVVIDMACSVMSSDIDASCSVVKERVEGASTGEANGRCNV